MTTVSEPWDTAIHESGHAIVAVLLGLPFEGVELVVSADGAASGQILYGPGGPPPLRGSRRDPAFMRRLEAHLRLYLAGKIAEDLAAERQAEGPRTVPASRLAEMEEDRQSILQILHALEPLNPWARRRRCDVAIAWCQEQLRPVWPAVEAVARALLEQRRLSAAQVHAILSSS